MRRGYRVGWLRTLAAVTAAAAAADAAASGFRVPDVSVAGLGTGNALVANADEPGALPYNPAAMAFRDGTVVVAGLVVIDHHVAVTPAGNAAEVESTHDSPAYVPNFAFAHRLNSAIGLGLTVNAPFGLVTEWPADTFPVLSAPPTRAAHPAKSSLELININPNVSYRLTERTAIAFGLDYYWVREVELDTTLIGVAGDGNGLGWNLALLHIEGPWSFGAAYRSGVNVDVAGTMTTPLAATPVNSEVDLPWTLQIGARYKAGDRLGIEFDYERVGWERFDAIVITGAPGGPLVNTNNWNGANAYRLSLTYDVDARVQLRGGYGFDETGEDGDHFSARIADADRQLFTLGLRYMLTNGWSVEGAYAYVNFAERNYASPVAFGSYGADPNGTSAYNGRYDSGAHLLGLGFTKQF